MSLNLDKVSIWKINFKFRPSTS